MKQTIDLLQKFIEEEHINVYDVAGMDENGVFYKSLQPANIANDSYSVSKSFTAAVIGALIDRQLLRLDTRVYPFFEEEMTAESDEKWKKVTVEQLLIHAFGQEQGYMFGVHSGENHDNWNEYIFRQPLQLEVGKTMRYSNVGGYLLAQIATKVYGKPFAECARELIFRPLDFRYFGMVTCNQGKPLGATGYILRTVDMAKFGYMYANNGVYNGKRVLSEEWIRTASTTRISDGRRFYTCGCLWRNGKERQYFADGANGQMIWIDPEGKFAVAIHSYTNVPACKFAEYLTQNRK